MAQFKHFKCKKCGFEFELFADYENMDAKEYKEISSCPCGKQMEETLKAEQEGE